MTADLTARRFFMFLLIGTTVLLAAVILPIASSLIMAAVLASVLWPLQQKLARRVGNRRGLAAGLLVFGVVILMLGPFAAVAAFVVNEASAGAQFVSGALHGQRAAELLQQLPEPVRQSAVDALRHLPGPQGARALAAGWAALTATGQFVFRSVLMLIALFGLLTQGDAFVLWLDFVSPLRKGQTRELLAEVKSVSYALVVSTVVTAAVQTAVALVGYFIAGVPYPVFFAAVTFFCAFIPALGATSVCLLAALILLVIGHPYSALFLTIWGLVVVGLIDNVIKPVLIKGGLRISGVVVFFALLGGLAAFGPLGLLLGPLAVSLFVALLRMRERDFIGKEVAG
jgi:predicted PurR-regulated permease PerM